MRHFDSPLIHRNRVPKELAISSHARKEASPRFGSLDEVMRDRRAVSLSAGDDALSMVTRSGRLPEWDGEDE